jgi:hypothetical protein
MEDGELLVVARQVMAAYQRLLAELDGCIAHLEDCHAAYGEMRAEVAALSASIIPSD